MREGLRPREVDLGPNKGELPEPNGLPCPRCNSTNTKFLFYNNKSLSQPRHLCHACRRSWTQGGTVRGCHISHSPSTDVVEDRKIEEGGSEPNVERGEDQDVDADLSVGANAVTDTRLGKRRGVESSDKDEGLDNGNRPRRGRRPRGGKLPCGARHPPEPDNIPCPRCYSTNTKFLSYNNKKVSQPRYGCNSCCRSWTRGGILRGGRRARKMRRLERSDKEKDTIILGLKEGDETTKIDGNEMQVQVSKLTDPDCIEDSLDKGKLEGKRNGCDEPEHVECIEEAYGDAHGDNHTVKPTIGRGRKGKRRKLESSDVKDAVSSGLVKGDETKSTEGNKMQLQVPKLTDPGCVEDSLDESKMEEKRNGSEESGHMKCNGEPYVEIHGDNYTGKPKIGRGRKGKKKTLLGSSMCSGKDAAPHIKKVEEDSCGGMSQVVGRILRSRTVDMNDSEKMGDVGLVRGDAGGSGKKESAQLMDRRKKKLKGKLRGKSGPLKVISREKQNEVVSTENGDQKSLLHARHNIALKQSNRNNHKEGEEPGTDKRTEKQLLRDRIMTMLKSAGWTIEYRPRQGREKGREYFDAVYVSPKGIGYWSVTLAYKKLKEHVASGDADSRALSAFTPIPKEEFSKLFRITKKQLGLKMGSKRQTQGANKTNKGVTQKKKFKKKNATERIGGLRRNHRGKLGSATMRGPMSSKRRAKHKSSDSEEDVSANTLQRGMQRSGREKKHKRKGWALLVRDSNKGLDPDSEGSVLYDGKRSLLSWMIDLGTVPLGGKVQYMNHRKTQSLLEGRITRDGINCDCCKKTLALSDFESHAGSTLMQPFQNIYLESGASLLQCLVDSWSKHDGSECIGFHSVNIDGGDPNDDTCNKCGDGGDLICCDGCPSTFHQNCLNIQNFPSGDWRCVYCSCKFCGMVGGNTCQSSQTCATMGSALLTCQLCEEKYHQLCVQVKDAVHVDSNCPSFCGKKCQEVFERLQVLLGVKHQLEEGYSWSLCQRFDVSPDTSLGCVPQKVECNSKLAVAFSILDECFLPIVDERSGINMIRNVVYSCGSNFSRLNYTGFFTAILERGDEIISAASLRIHGNHLAEMPFIGTRHIYRRQGMCRRLLNAIELALCSLNVEKLVIPAISEMLQTWTSVFGFMPLEESKRKEMRYMNMVVFPGVAMLQKPILNQQFGGENQISTAATKSTEHRTEHQITHEGEDESDLLHSAGSDPNVSHQVTSDHAHETRDIAAAASVLQLPDVPLDDSSDITSMAVNLQETFTSDKCHVHSHANCVWENKAIEDSEEINNQENAHKSFAVSIQPDTSKFEGTLDAADGKGKEGAGCERNGRVNSVYPDICTLSEDSVRLAAEFMTRCQDASLSHSKAAVAKDCYALIPNPSDSCPRVVPQSHEPEIVASVHSNCFTRGGDSIGAPKSNSLGSHLSNGLCKSSECQSDCDENDTSAVNKSALNHPVGASLPSYMVTGKDIHNLKEDFTSAHTDFRSLDVDPLPNRSQMSTNCSKESESGAQVDHTVLV